MTSLGVFGKLSKYRPVLASTITLAIDTADSDLDVICEAQDLDEFGSAVESMFGGQTDFFAWRRNRHGTAGAVARFTYAGFPIEIYGEQRPVEQQNAFRHLQVFARLLARAEANTAGEIRKLRALGLKPEPAFAQYFRLAGDPYQALLQLYDADEATVRRIAGFHSEK